jgi:peptidoglycan-N-acetylmuramic acid deacetylase
MGYKTVFWSFAYADWDNNNQPSEQDAIKKILDNAHPGEIMLLHPTSATNAAIMDKLITELKGQGYRFGELGELWQKDAR